MAQVSSLDMIQRKTSSERRLFLYRHGLADAEPNRAPYNVHLDQPIVQVEIRDDEQGTDLVSSLSQQFTQGSSYHVIFEPSDVVAFKLTRQEVLPSYSGAPSSNRRQFKYPNHLYLDQFLKENVEVASERRKQQKEVEQEISRLNARKTAILHTQVS